MAKKNKYKMTPMPGLDMEKMRRFYLGDSSTDEWDEEFRKFARMDAEENRKRREKENERQ